MSHIRGHAAGVVQLRASLRCKLATADSSSLSTLPLQTLLVFCEPNAEAERVGWLSHQKLFLSHCITPVGLFQGPTGEREPTETAGVRGSQHLGQAGFGECKRGKPRARRTLCRHPRIHAIHERRWPLPRQAQTASLHKSVKGICCCQGKGRSGRPLRNALKTRAAVLEYGPSEVAKPR